MPLRPSAADVHVDTLLSDISSAYILDDNQFVGSQLSTPVPVKNQSDIITRFDKDYWFTDEAATRSPGTETAGSDFAIDATLKYFTIEKGFHKDIPYEVIDNQDQPVDMDLTANAWVMQKLMIHADVLLAAEIFVSGKWATDTTIAAGSKWDDYGASTPIVDAETAKEGVHATTGQEVTHTLWGRQVWNKVKHHPALLERYKYTQAGVITKELVARVIEVDKLVIGQSIRNTAVEGATGVYAYNYGKNALFLHQAPSPNLLTPTGFHTFIWNKRGRDRARRLVTIRRLENQWKQFTRIEGLFNIDHVIVGSDLGYLYLAAVA